MCPQPTLLGAARMGLCSYPQVCISAARVMLRSASVALADARRCRFGRVSSAAGHIRMASQKCTQAQQLSLFCAEAWMAFFKVLKPTSTRLQAVHMDVPYPAFAFGSRCFHWHGCVCFAWPVAHLLMKPPQPDGPPVQEDLSHLSLCPLLMLSSLLASAAPGGCPRLKLHHCCLLLGLAPHKRAALQSSGTLGWHQSQHALPHLRRTHLYERSTNGIRTAQVKLQVQPSLLKQPPLTCLLLGSTTRAAIRQMHVVGKVGLTAYLRG